MAKGLRGASVESPGAQQHLEVASKVAAETSREMDLNGPRVQGKLNTV